MPKELGPVDILLYDLINKLFYWMNRHHMMLNPIMCTRDSTPGHKSWEQLVQLNAEITRLQERLMVEDKEVLNVIYLFKGAMELALDIKSEPESLRRNALLSDFYNTIKAVFTKLGQERNFFGHYANGRLLRDEIQNQMRSDKTLSAELIKKIYKALQYQTEFLKFYCRNEGSGFSKICDNYNFSEILAFCKNYLNITNSKGCIQKKLDIINMLVGLTSVYMRLESYFGKLVKADQFKSFPRTSDLENAVNTALLLFEQLDKHMTLLTCSSLYADKNSALSRLFAAIEHAKKAKIREAHERNSFNMSGMFKSVIQGAVRELLFIEDRERGCVLEEVAELFKKNVYPDELCKNIGKYINSIYKKSAITLLVLEHDSDLLNLLQEVHFELKSILRYGKYREEMIASVVSHLKQQNIPVNHSLASIEERPMANTSGVTISCQ